MSEILGQIINLLIVSGIIIIPTIWAFYRYNGNRNFYLPLFIQVIMFVLVPTLIVAWIIGMVIAIVVYLLLTKGSASFTKYLKDRKEHNESGEFIVKMSRMTPQERDAYYKEQNKGKGRRREITYESLKQDSPVKPNKTNTAPTEEYYYGPNGNLYICKEGGIVETPGGHVIRGVRNGNTIETEVGKLTKR